MKRTTQPIVAIVDYGLGNLFSIKHVCNHVGLQALVTSTRQEIEAADAIILPGVGAFGDAIQALYRLDLVSLLKDMTAAGKPLIGICLGMQLLMTESYEFGCHKGLDLIKGSVVRFDNPIEKKMALKVPQVGWNKLSRGRQQKNWSNTLLDGLREGEYMYFIHSYHVQPEDPLISLSVSQYGHIEFCSSLQRQNIMAFQFHPERSGRQGVRIYQNFENLLQKNLAANS